MSGPPGPRRALLTACALGGSAGWAMTAVGAGARSVADGYGTGLWWVGVLSAALATPYALLQFPAGALVDRVGVRTAAVSGLVLVLAAHAAALTTAEPGLALGGRFLSGVGFAACFVCGAELARSSGLGSRGMGLFGGVALATSGGAVLGVALVEPLLGWRAPWVTTGVTAAVALLLAWRLPAGPPRAPGRRPAAPSRSSPDPVERQGPRSLLLDGVLARLTAIHTVTLGLGLVLSTWASTLLADVWGFGTVPAAVVGSLVLGLSVVSRPLGGVLAAGVAPSRHRVAWAVTLVACAVATLALAHPAAAAVAVLAVVVLGGCSGLPFAAVVAAAQARQPQRPAAAVGLMNTLAFGLVVAGTPLLGWAIDHGRAETALLVVAIGWLVPLLALPAPVAAPRPVGALHD